MKLGTNEKRTAVAALNHALAASKDTQQIHAYANLRKKFETAMRNERAEAQGGDER